MYSDQKEKMTGKVEEKEKEKMLVLVPVRLLTDAASSPLCSSQDHSSDVHVSRGSYMK